MKKTLLISLTVLLSGMAIHAQQQVIASAGNYSSNSSGSLSWTLGEPIVESYTASGSILTQGFQQSFKTTIPISVVNTSQYYITASPNPAIDKVFIETANPEGLQYNLYDMSGRMVRSAKIKSTKTDIDLTDLSPSVYFIKIIKGNTEVKTFKLVKL